jgi:hypothetical protein
MLRSTLRAFAAAVSLAATLGAVPALAQEPGGWRFELSPPVSYATGHTTYRIEATDGVNSVASELEFPIRAALVGVRGRAAQDRALERRGIALEATVAFVFATDPRAKLEDSDWLEGSADPFDNPGKDIFSTSNAEISGSVLEARVAWEFDARMRGVVLAPMLGVLRQRFEYEVTDVEQVGFGGWAADHTGSVSGRVLAYEVTHLLPYIGGRLAMTRGLFTGTAEAWFSPVAQADDFDDHLLRGKTARTDASGSAWSATAGARFALGARHAIQAQASILRVSTSGSQRQRWYRDEFDADGNVIARAGDTIVGIPSEITSSRATFSLAYVLSL